MSLSDQDRKKLWGRSGNLCSYPGCGIELASAGGAERVLGEEAHIKGEKKGAARFDPEQPPDERESYENWVLVCPTHHVTIDSDEKTWTVAKLYEMKLRHERNVETNRKFPELISDLRDLVRRYDGPDPSSSAVAQETFDHPKGTIIVRVDARSEKGVDTKIDLRAGQRIAFFARGLITFNGGHDFTNPEGVLCNQLGLPQVVTGPSGDPSPVVWPHPQAYPTDGGKLGRIGRLIGWIGEDRANSFSIGARREMKSPASGRLFLAINDARGTYSDNDGEYRVDIHVTDPV
jgi:hypothetical protein